MGRHNTILERAALKSDAIPELHTYCQQHGLDFQLVDMHHEWLTDSCTDHTTAGRRLQELRDCYNVSCGPFFVSIIGDRYGECPLPQHINEIEFCHVRDTAVQLGKDVSLLEEWYVKDENAVPPEYVLQPIEAKLPHYGDRSEENEELMAHYHNVWLNTFNALQDLLYKSAQAAHQRRAISTKQLSKYQLSGVEAEVLEALSLDTEPSKNCVFFLRTLEGLSKSLSDPSAKNFTDINSSLELDSAAQEKLRFLRDSYINEKVDPDNTVRLCTVWKESGLDPSAHTEHKSYLADFCSQFVAKVKQLIDRVVDNYAEMQYLKETPIRELYYKLLESSAVSLAHSQKFVAREDVVSAVRELVTSEESKPIVLYGGQGSGKSAVVSKVATSLSEWTGTQPICVLRYIHSPTCTHTLLNEICQQLCATNLEGELEKIPVEYRKLVSFFNDLLLKASKWGNMTVLLLDGVERLLPTEGTLTFDWLPAELPSGVKLVLSLTEGSVLDELKERIGDKQRFVELSDLTEKERMILMDSYFTHRKRRITAKQRVLLKNALQQPCSPLMLTLLCREVESGSPQLCQNGSKMPQSAEEAANIVYDGLESRHDPVCLGHVLASICAGRAGVRETELLCMLSCCDAIMDPLCQQTNRGDRTFPHTFWAAIKHDLDNVMTVSLLDGVLVVHLAHEAFQKVALERYGGGEQPIRKQHGDFADILSGCHGDNKLSPSHINAEVKNGTPTEPTSAATQQFSIRQQNELWYQLVLAGNLRDLKSKALCCFPYLLAKMQCSSVYELLHCFNVKCVHVCNLRDLKSKALCCFPYLLAKMQCSSVYELLHCFHVASQHVLDAEVNLVLLAMEASISALIADGQQLGAQLISRLVYKGDKALDSLIHQALEWGRNHNKALLLPHTSWLITKQKSLVKTLDCPGVRHMVTTADTQHVICTATDHTITMYSVGSGKAVQTFEGHKDNINCIYLSHSGKFFLSGSDDQTVQSWCLETGQGLRTYSGHTAGVMCMTLAHNDQIFATGAKDHIVRVFSFECREPQQVIEQHTAAITCITLTRHDDILVTAGADCRIHVWLLNKKKLLNTIWALQPEEEPPKEEQLKLANCRIHVWLLNKKKLLNTIWALQPEEQPPKEEQKLVNTIWALQPEEEPPKEKQLKSPDCRIHVWLLNKKKLLNTIWALQPEEEPPKEEQKKLLNTIWALQPEEEPPKEEQKEKKPKKKKKKSEEDEPSDSMDDEHTGGNTPPSSPLPPLPILVTPVVSMVLSKNNSFLVSGCENGDIHVWALTTGSLVHQLLGIKGKVTCVAIANDSVFAALGCENGSILVFNIRTKALMHTLQGHQAPVTDVAISHDDHFILSAAEDDTVHVWNLDKMPVDREETDSISKSVTCITVGTVERDGSSIALSGGKDGSCRLWSMDTYKMLHHLQDHVKAITCVALSSNGTFAVSGSEDTTIKVWSVDNGLVVLSFVEHSAPIAYVTVTSDDTRILSADIKNSLKLWQAESGNILLSCTGPSLLVAVTPDNQNAVSGDRDNVMKIWTLSDGKVVQSIKHVDSISCIAISLDSQLCVTGSHDMSLKVWEAKTGKLTQILAGHDDVVTCVQVAEQKQRVVSGSVDKTVIVWNLNTGQIEQTLSGHTGTVTCLGLANDADTVISGSDDGTIRVWSANTGVHLTRMDMYVGIRDLKVPLDGTHVIVHLTDKAVVPILQLLNGKVEEVKFSSETTLDEEKKRKASQTQKTAPGATGGSRLFANGRKSTRGKKQSSRARLNSGGSESVSSGYHSNNQPTPKHRKKSKMCQIV
ncbi:NACHT domain- and WD repeat-containing protein 1-like [Branchiostoma floridae]|uniref:NACHT domain- and WD repeat-containing protein 1-like n=1 Tax=Branchiostoma floridae TaxID=7739 RepID=A0A9J7MJT1_BRAFL|nr:NACHT domain- and WD repeat-containing protein 1-like [Branchiostoma floridae]